MIRVLLAEDHHLVRQGLRALLERTNDIQVVGEAATGQEAVDLTLQLAPDVVIMDLAMPRMDGVQATERIAAMDVPTQVVVVSMHSDPALIHQIVRRGAKGYLLKDALAEELVLAVRSASQGRLYLSPTVSEGVMALLISPRAAEDVSSVADLLTPREREVLQLVAEGHINQAIAQALNISVKTVEKHRANVMTKLGVSDLASLVRVALRLGLVFPDQ